MEEETKQVIREILPIVEEKIDIWYLAEVPIDPASIFIKFPIGMN